MAAKVTARGSTAKHAGTRKHHHTAKHHPHHHKKPVASAHHHHVHTAAKPAKGAKPRGFAVGDLLPACAFEAVAMSLRLLGQRVHQDDVAGLWELYGEVSIPEAVAAFAEIGPGRMAAVRSLRPGAYVAADCPASGWPLQPSAQANQDSALLLGVDLPGPHAVLATPDGWWSWGELHDPWPCRIEEAWVISWA